MVVPYKQIAKTYNLQNSVPNMLNPTLVAKADMSSHSMRYDVRKLWELPSVIGSYFNCNQD